MINICTLTQVALNLVATVLIKGRGEGGLGREGMSEKNEGFGRRKVQALAVAC